MLEDIYKEVTDELTERKAAWERKETILLQLTGLMIILFVIGVLIQLLGN